MLRNPITFFWYDMILQQYWQKFRGQSRTFNLRGWARIRFGKQLLLKFFFEDTELSHSEHGLQRRIG